MNWCRFGFHKWEDVKMQITKYLGFGWAGLPGYRMRQRCKNCLLERYIKLNLCMPDKYLHVEEIWRDNG